MKKVKSTFSLKEVSEEVIINKIYTIRGRRVMLDKDLAGLYGVKPIALRQQVKRNWERFPGDFMFQITDKEVKIMVSQNVIPSKKYLGGHLPYLFTEYGAIMIASVLNSKRAVDVSISVVRAFIKMRQMLMEYKELKKKIEKMERKYDYQFKIVFDAIKKLLEPPPSQTLPKQIKGFLRDKI
ncbi:MAG: ORF6N domain-containing protein [Elusimicrobiota bacterium]